MPYTNKTTTTQTINIVQTNWRWLRKNPNTFSHSYLSNIYYWLLIFKPESGYDITCCKDFIDKKFKGILKEYSPVHAWEIQYLYDQNYLIYSPKKGFHIYNKSEKIGFLNCSKDKHLRDLWKRDKKRKQESEQKKEILII